MKEHLTATKVPHVAAMFWVVKLLTTGMGEAMSDFIASLPTVVAGVTLVVLAAAAVAIFRSQLLGRRYEPVRYWGTVAMIAVFGTMAADVLHVLLGNVGATAVYVVLLAVVLGLWHRSEGSISIHSITTTRREWFYWTTVAATFALGTAAGDVAADTLHLGYRDAAGVFALIMLVIAAAWRLFSLPAVPAFWSAYVFTRPLGASIADWLGKPAHPDHGLAWGDGPVAVGSAVLVVALILWLQRSGADRPRVTEPA